jgi:hypothetical protein
VVAGRQAERLRFSTPIAVTSAAHAHDAGELHLTAGAGRILLAANESDRRGPYRVTLRTWTPTSGLSTPKFLSPGLGSGFMPTVAAGGPRVVVAWQADDGIDAATSDGGGPFTAPEPLSDPGLTVASTIGPDVAVDQRGVALVAWEDYGNSEHVELARRAP